MQLDTSDVARALEWAHVRSTTDTFTSISYIQLQALNNLPPGLYDSLRDVGLRIVSDVGPGRVLLDNYGPADACIILDVPWFRTGARTMRSEWALWATWNHSLDLSERLMAAVGLYYLSIGAC